MIAKQQVRSLTLTKILCLFFFHLSSQIYASEKLTASNYQPRHNADFDQAVDNFLTNGPKKIVGGNVAAVGAFPWQASLEVSWIDSPTDAHYCGGSIYNSMWILTAAHCIENLDSDQIAVVVGSNILSNGIRKIPVERTIVHPKYGKLTEHDSDVGLILLKEPLNFDVTTRPIAAATAQDDQTLAPDNADLIVTGWGYTTENGNIVRNLREVTVPVTPIEACKDPLSYGPTQISDNMICAGRALGGMDACQGDSGGPLVSVGMDARQIGIVSWGEGCARPARYGVYTRVSKFKEWIDSCVAGARKN
ncbi:MAG: serine protease [Roseiarcus sp.]